MTDLHKLNCFVTVARTLNFGRAARSLNLSQPPLTRHIKALEAELGAELFHRTKRSVRLSDAGAALLPQVEAILQAVARLPDAARAGAAGSTGRISIAFVSIVDYSFLPALLRRFTGAHPGVSVHLREATSDLQLKWLAAGEIDLGVVLGPMVDAGSGGKAPEALVYQRLQTESLVLALPQAHPQAHPQAKLATPVALARFSNEAFISFPRHAAPGLHDAVTGACSEAGFSQRVVQEAIQMQTIISLVSAGMGVALVPESLMSLRRPGVVYRKLRGGKRAALEIGLVWRRDNAAAVLKRFVELAGA